MTRAMVALFGAALAFPGFVLALGFGEALGGDWFVGGVMFALVVCCGFPALSLYCRRRWWDPWRFVAGGTLGATLFALPFLGSGRFGFGYLVVAFALIGGMLAAVFWLAAIWRNDELTAPREFCLPCGVAYRYARNALRRRRVSG